MNWLNTSSGSTPAYKFALQPDDAGYSANANIELWTISDVGYNSNILYRNSLVRYFLPSAHEWCKAAYYDPSSGVYNNYPNGSDTAPTAVVSGTAAGSAVYSQSFATGPADITLAGGLSLRNDGPGRQCLGVGREQLRSVEQLQFVCSRESRRQLELLLQPLPRDELRLRGLPDRRARRYWFSRRKYP